MPTEISYSYFMAPNTSALYSEFLLILKKDCHLNYFSSSLNFQFFIRKFKTVPNTTIMRATIVNFIFDRISLLFTVTRFSRLVWGGYILISFLYMINIITCTYCVVITVVTSVLPLTASVFTFPAFSSVFLLILVMLSPRHFHFIHRFPILLYILQHCCGLSQTSQ